MAAKRLAVAAEEIQNLHEQREYLALDNLLLARRMAEAERKLEAAAKGSGLFSRLFAPSSSSAELLDAASAHLDARTDENVQLQHALFQQQLEHTRALAQSRSGRQAEVDLLRRELSEAEAEAEVERVAGAASAAAAEHQLRAQQSQLDRLCATCLELRARCEATMSELDVSNRANARLRERDEAHQQWRARLRRAWRREQAECLARAEAEEARRWEGVEEEAQSVLGSTPAEADVDGRAMAELADTHGHAAVEPAWLSAAAAAVSLSDMDGDGRAGGGGGGGDDDDDARDDGSSSRAGGGCSGEGLRDVPPSDTSALRAELAAERERRVRAEAAAADVEAELHLSGQRFQQQIALLSEALAEAHQKEDARRRRLAALREQKKAQPPPPSQQHGLPPQQQPQQQPQPQPLRPSQPRPPPHPSVLEQSQPWPAPTYEAEVGGGAPAASSECDAVGSVSADEAADGGVLGGMLGMGLGSWAVPAIRKHAPLLAGVRNG